MSNSLEKLLTTRTETGELPPPLMHSDLERAIGRCDLKDIEYCLKNGEHACNDNCIFFLKYRGNWEVLKCILAHDPLFLKSQESVDSKGRPKLLLFLQYGTCERNIKHFLKLGANPNSVGNDGKTVLMASISNNAGIKGVRALLNAGADATATDDDGHNALHYAAMYAPSLNIDMFKLLVEEKRVDPVIETTVRAETVLNYAIRNFLKLFYQTKRGASEKQKKTMEERYNAVKYLFELPQFKNFIFNCESSRHPQYLLFTVLHCTWTLNRDNDVNYAKIYDFEFFFKPQFLNKNLVVNATVECPTVCKFIYNYQPGNQYTKLNFGPIGSYINCSSENAPLCSRKLNFSILKNFLEKLKSHQFSLSDPPDCISPLTLTLFKTVAFFPENSCFETILPVTIKFVTHDYLQKKKPTYKLDMTYEIVKLFVENGVNVGQKMLRQHGTDEEYDRPDIDDIYAELQLPDAVFAALTDLIYKKVQPLSLRYLLPYVASPPLSLLLLVPRSKPELISVWYPILAEFGPLPAGSSLLTRLRQHLHEIALYDNRLTIPAYEAFIEMHNVVPSLLDMCRCQVRLNLRSSPGNLPDIIENMTAPGLNNYLMMKPSEPIHVVVCENEQIAEKAKFMSRLDIQSHVSMRNYVYESD